MRVRLTGRAAGVLLLLAVGCGTSVNTAPPTPDEEKAAEQRIKDEAARELKDRREEQKNKKVTPDD